MSFKVGDRVIHLEIPTVAGSVVELGDTDAQVTWDDGATTWDEFKDLRPESDMVNHPAHYTGHPTIEAIEVLEHVQDYRLGTAMKYLWRIAFGGKHDSVEDAKKAVWYINRWLEKQSDV